ncbi:MAG: hypothetical protein SNJ56_03250 [Termitinemataceae bacterium]
MSWLDSMTFPRNIGPTFAQPILWNPPSRRSGYSIGNEGERNPGSDFDEGIPVMSRSEGNVANAGRIRENLARCGGKKSQER